MVTFYDKSGNGGNVDPDFANGSVTLVRSGATIAANTGTDTKSVRAGGYIWAANFTGTSIKLQALGADSTTWGDVTTLNSSGTAAVVLGDASSVRVYNPNGAAVTGVSSSLS